jgi:polysaccharide export outer membrane protein
MTKKQIALSLLMVFYAVLLSGCFSAQPQDIQYFTKPDQVVVNFDKYVLKPADEIEIHCLNVPELNLQKQKIRPDGKVSFEGIGPVEAAGKTPEELASNLHEKALLLYSLSGEHPIDVRIDVYKSAYYYVLGQVYFEGPKICTGRDTVLTALTAARLNTIAWKDHIQVIRPSSDVNVRPKIFEIKYDKMVAHGDMSKNVLLQEGDIIFVPPTVLGGAGLVVGEFLNPIGRAFSAVSVVQPAQ